VLELLALGFMMEIDDDKGLVTATRHSFSSISVEQREGRRALHAFSRMAKGMPPVSSTGGEHPGEALGLSTRIAAILGAITFFGGMPFYVISAGRQCNDLGLSCALPGIIAAVPSLVIAIGIGFLIRPPLIARYKGTSSSSSHVSAFVMVVGMAIFMVCTLLGARFIGQGLFSWDG
jgi:hypothetical protein